MKRVTILVLIMCLALVGLSVSCKNEVEPAQETDRLVAIGFNDATSRALSSNLEAFNAADYYWAYAAQKADTSRLKSGETASYNEAGAVWVKSNDNVPVKGLGSVGTSGYQAYRVEGFSQGLWNFKLFAYKDADKTQLVYQGETTGVLLKSSATNAVANHTVNVIVSPVSSEATGTLQILTASSETDHITMTLLQAYASEAPEYGVDYFPRVLSIATLDENPDEKVDDLEGGTIVANGTISLPAGTYKVTVAFSNAADSSATVNYARGTVIATVYSNLTTTIKGNLNEADVYAEFTSNQSINTVTGSTGFEEATIAAAPAPVASSVAEPNEVGSEHKTSDSTPSAKTTVSSSATAVTATEDKKTTVTIPAAGLADTVVTKTLTEKTNDNNKTVTTVTESSTHDLSMKVTDAEATTPSTISIASGSSKVAGVNLTLTKTKTTVTETATTTSGITETVTTSATAAPQTITSFNDKYVTVSTYIETGLTGVSVVYDGTGDAPVFSTTNNNPNVATASADATISDAGTGYNPTTGLIVFKTNHFSSFVVTCYQVVKVTRGNETTYYNSLSAFRDAVNAGDSFGDAVVSLMRDVDLKDVEWTPIGTSSSPFRGVFDGQNYTISNYKINTPNDRSGAGLFGIISGEENSDFNSLSAAYSDKTLHSSVVGEDNYTCVVKNIKIKNVVTTAVENGDCRITAALVAKATNAFISNIEVSDSEIVAHKYGSAIAAYVNGTIIKDCSVLSSVTIRGVGNSSGHLAGIVAQGDAGGRFNAIINATNNANITGYYGNIGGISAMGKRILHYNCVNNGEISIINNNASSTTECGGIDGNGDESWFVMCTNYGDIIATNAQKSEKTPETSGIAGIVGYHQNLGQESVFHKCYNYGDITNTGEYATTNLAGIAMDQSMPSCYEDVANYGVLHGDYANNVYDISSNNTMGLYISSTMSFSALVEELNSKNATSVTIQAEITGELGTIVLPSNTRVISSAYPIATAFDLSQLTDDYLSIDVPGSFEIVGLGIKSVAISGDSVVEIGDNETSNARITLKGQSCTLTHRGRLEHANFDGTGSYTLNNHGTISHTKGSNESTSHTVSSIKICEITINNYGIIESKKGSLVQSDYALLFYYGQTVVFNAYNGSTVSTDGTALFVISGGTTVTLNYQDGCVFRRGTSEYGYPPFSGSGITINHIE